MDNLLVNGDLEMDGCGSVKQVVGLEEIIQRAMIRLKVKQGSFAYDPSLGSRLHNLDIHRTDEFTLLSLISEALQGLEEVAVISVAKSVDREKDALYLTVALKAGGQDAVLELGSRMWGQ